MTDKTIVVRGTLHWAKITGDARPYQGNPRYDKGPSWSVDVTPDEASLAKMKAVGLDSKLRTPKGEKETRTKPFLTLRHLLNGKDGKKNKPIPITDIRGNKWDDDVEIGNGSIADVMIKVKDYGADSALGSYIQKVRVLDLVEYSGKDFEPVSEDDEFFGKAAKSDKVGNIDDLDDAPWEDEDVVD